MKEASFLRPSPIPRQKLEAKYHPRWLSLKEMTFYGPQTKTQSKGQWMHWLVIAARHFSNFISSKLLTMSAILNYSKRLYSLNLL